MRGKLETGESAPVGTFTADVKTPPPVVVWKGRAFVLGYAYGEADSPKRPAQHKNYDAVYREVEAHFVPGDLNPV